MTDPVEPTDPVESPEPAQEPKEPDWKAEARKWENLSKANKKKADEHAAAARELASLKESSSSEQEKAVQAARKEAEAASTSKYRTRIITSEIKAAAGGKLADPADAVRLLDLDQFELDDNDELDPQAVENAIAALLKQKPYLAAEKPRFQGGADQGARHTPQPTSIAEQIAEAQAKGDFSTAGALKAQQLRELSKAQTT